MVHTRSSYSRGVAGKLENLHSLGNRRSPIPEVGPTATVSTTSKGHAESSKIEDAPLLKVQNENKPVEDEPRRDAMKAKMAKCVEEKREEERAPACELGKVDNGLFLNCLGLITFVKFFLVNFYYSTDLEVHRNWMAITSSLPMSEWYFENTSEWTLDYPPFFAYFELVLSQFGEFFDSNILTISASAVMSDAILLYMRLTVIVTDLLYYYAAYRWIEYFAVKFPNLKYQSHFLFFFNVGHLFVDSIHFQYNGFLHGILLLSMLQMVKGQIYWSAFSFAVLLNFKHIYIYMAPGYGLYLFFAHCLYQNEKQQLQLNWKNLFTLAGIVLSVFAVSVGPFVLNGSLSALLGRLFPFGRGLTHAYWAPNFWSFYNFFDITLSVVLGVSGGHGITSGLVQQSNMKVLPNISPPTTLCIIVALLVLYASVTFRRQSLNFGFKFPQVLFFSTAAFYFFGYHVHEKAILLIVCSLAPFIWDDPLIFKTFIQATFVGYISLFPLFFSFKENLVKWILMSVHIGGFVKIIQSQRLQAHFSLIEKLYFVALIIAAGYESLPVWILPLVIQKFTFLPLMLLSVVAAVGLGYTFVFYSVIIFFRI